MQNYFMEIYSLKIKFILDKYYNQIILMLFHRILN